MKKEIAVADEARGIVTVTTVDERWYARPARDVETGLPAFEYVPSVTWITSFYPKGPEFERWLMTHGSEAETIKALRGETGSKVHQGAAALTAGQTVAMGDLFVNPTTGQPEPLSAEEYGALLAFLDWWQTLRAPRVLLGETVVWGDGYAGTLDLLIACEEAGAEVVWLIDLKTSKHVYPSHEIQVTAYRDALPSVGINPAGVKLAVLQLGYRNRHGWKFTPVAYQPELFAATRAIWAKETAGQRPAQRDYPLTLNLGIRPATAKPCAKCQGTGARPCRHCKGSGYSPKKLRKCGGECKGAGRVPCSCLAGLAAPQATPDDGDRTGTGEAA